MLLLTRVVGPLFALCAVLMGSPHASAQAAEAPPPTSPPSEATPTTDADHDWRIGVELGTVIPADFNIGLHVEAPYRIIFRTSLGIMPSFYVDMINEIGTSVSDGYTDLTAALISTSLDNSLIWRNQLGWRPWSHLGLYFTFSYTLAALGGDTAPQEVLEEATGQTLPADPMAQNRDFAIDATLHMIGGEVGYVWSFYKGFYLNTSVGMFGTVASSATVEAQFRSSSPVLLDALERGTENYLNDIFQTYVISPSIALTLGYVFY